MIEVSGLSKRYGNIVAVTDANFTVNDGEVVGFLGPNGAGKSTIMNMLTGYLSMTEGTITVDGFDILEDPNEVKRRIGYLPEQPPLYLDMTVKEYLYFIYDIKGVKFPKKAHIDEICDLVKIEDVRNRLIKNLSKGYRQRVGIAQALVGNPDVLILDEPTVGLDPKQIIEIRNLISRLGHNHTIILSSHILSEIQAICKRIIIINRGEIIADDDAENLSRNISGDNTLLLRIMGPEKEVAKTLLATKGVGNVTCLGRKEENASDYTIEPLNMEDVRRTVFERMAEKNFAILNMQNNDLSLEQIFLRLTEASDSGIDILKNHGDEDTDVEITEETTAEIAEETDETKGDKQ